jgi:hypothetical protein
MTPSEFLNFTSEDEREKIQEFMDTVVKYFEPDGIISRYNHNLGDLLLDVRRAAEDLTSCDKPDELADRITRRVEVGEQLWANIAQSYARVKSALVSASPETQL